jgi:hypothetical protein
VLELWRQEGTGTEIMTDADLERVKQQVIQQRKAAQRHAWEQATKRQSLQRQDVLALQTQSPPFQINLEAAIMASPDDFVMRLRAYCDKVLRVRKGVEATEA